MVDSELAFLQKPSTSKVFEVRVGDAVTPSAAWTWSARWPLVKALSRSTSGKIRRHRPVTCHVSQTSLVPSAVQRPQRCPPHRLSNKSDCLLPDDYTSRPKPPLTASEPREAKRQTTKSAPAVLATVCRRLLFFLLGHPRNRKQIPGYTKVSVIMKFRPQGAKN